MNRPPSYLLPSHTLVTALLATALLLQQSTPAQEIPSGNGQLEAAPVSIPGGIDDAGGKYSYLGQKASGGKIILTASNGFFTKGVAVAKGESKLPKVGDEELIVPNFAYLDWKAKEGSLRWHILISKPGVANFAVTMTSPGGAEIVARLGDMEESFTSSRSSGDSPQERQISFEVKEPGEYEFSLRSASTGGAPVGQLQQIDVFGPATEGAHLLRVRWRPAAVHGSYDTKKVPNSRTLVFTTSSHCDISSYSPITTPFGYYGTSFDGDRRSNGSFNFSMWGKDGAASDIKMMPHLLGIGSPEGEFSGFGHEGTGVKPRGWDPMPDRPALVVQALRLVPGETHDSYFGYYFDHPTNSWKFYAAGKKWHGGKSVDHLKLGSFCEVPGPPQNERTGDVYREVRRRGWSHKEGKWIPLETYNPGGKGSAGDIAVNKSWYTTKDNEYAMGCGGIRLYEHSAASIKPVTDSELPYFLTSPSISSIFEMPVEFGQIQATKVWSDGALIEFVPKSETQITEATLYYGTKEALTFAPRELHGTERNSSLSQAINQMAWEEKVSATNLSAGVNRFEIADLKPNQTYFYRILVKNAVSQIWSDPSRSFTTTKTGEQPKEVPSIFIRPGVPPETTAVSYDSENFRTWNYDLPGKQKALSFSGKLLSTSGVEVVIERESDGKKGVLEIQRLAEEDRSYLKRLQSSE